MGVIADVTDRVSVMLPRPPRRIRPDRGGPRPPPTPLHPRSHRCGAAAGRQGREVPHPPARRGTGGPAARSRLSEPPAGKGRPVSGGRARASVRADPLVEADNVSMDFLIVRSMFKWRRRTFTAVDRVSFSIRPGEVFWPGGGRAEAASRPSRASSRGFTGRPAAASRSTEAASRQFATPAGPARLSAADADDLPGPLRLPQPAYAGGGHRGRAGALPPPRGAHGPRRRRSSGICSNGWASTGRRQCATPTNSRAASASGSRSPAPSPPAHAFSSATSRPRPSTSPSRRKS